MTASYTIWDEAKPDEIQKSLQCSWWRDISLLVVDHSGHVRTHLVLLHHRLELDHEESLDLQAHGGRLILGPTGEAACRLTICWAGRVRIHLVHLHHTLEPQVDYRGRLDLQAHGDWRHYKDSIILSIGFMMPLGKLNSIFLYMQYFGWLIAL